MCVRASVRRWSCVASTANRIGDEYTQSQSHIQRTHTFTHVRGNSGSALRSFGESSTHSFYIRIHILAYARARACEQTGFSTHSHAHLACALFGVATIYRVCMRVCARVQDDDAQDATLIVRDPPAHVRPRPPIYGTANGVFNGAGALHFRAPLLSVYGVRLPRQPRRRGTVWWSPRTTCSGIRTSLRA